MHQPRVVSVALILVSTRRVLAFERAEIMLMPQYPTTQRVRAGTGLFRLRSSRPRTPGTSPWIAGEIVQLGEVEIEYTER
jgi:hypothetical protein